MKKIQIIAKIINDHNGKINLAKKLIREAKIHQIPSIMQTFITEDIIIEKTKKAKYQINKKNKKETQFSMLKRLAL